jgi:hypothetical protein
MTKYSEQDMLKLIDDCEREFKAEMAKAEESAEVKDVLTKAEDKMDEAKEKEPKAEEAEEKHSKKEEKESEAKEKEEHKPVDGKEAHKEHKEDEPLDYDEHDFEMMKSLYGGMCKAELCAHHVTAHKMMEAKGYLKPVDAMQSQTEHSHDGPKDVFAAYGKDPKSAMMQEKVLKSEDLSLDLVKSENNLLKKELEDLKKKEAAIDQFLKTLVEKKVAPKQKAITSLDYIKKSEDSEKVLTKSEIHNVLLTKSQDPNLSEKDREAINGYYLSGGSVDNIKHLLR